MPARGASSDLGDRKSHGGVAWGGWATARPRVPLGRQERGTAPLNPTTENACVRVSDGPRVLPGILRVTPDRRRVGWRRARRATTPSRPTCRGDSRFDPPAEGITLRPPRRTAAPDWAGPSELRFWAVTEASDMAWVDGDSRGPMARRASFTQGWMLRASFAKSTRRAQGRLAVPERRPRHPRRHGEVTTSTGWTCGTPLQPWRTGTGLRLWFRLLDSPTHEPPRRGPATDPHDGGIRRGCCSHESGVVSQWEDRTGADRVGSFRLKPPDVRGRSQVDGDSPPAGRTGAGDRAASGCPSGDRAPEISRQLSRPAGRTPLLGPSARRGARARPWYRLKARLGHPFAAGAKLRRQRGLPSAGDRTAGARSRCYQVTLTADPTRPANTSRPATRLFTTPALID